MYVARKVGHENEEASSEEDAWVEIGCKHKEVNQGNKKNKK